VKGNEFFMANYRAGMRVLDITNIGSGNDTTSMIETGYFDTYPANNLANFNGAWSVYPYFESGNIILNDIERGLFIVRKSGTLSVDTAALKKGLSISPNPMTSETTIRFLNNEMVKNIKVYTILGQKIFEKNTINQTKYVLTTTNFKRGIYIIKVNSRVTKKIVIK
jgi:Zn/Cd-binding protein ZinT